MNRIEDWNYTHNPEHPHTSGISVSIWTYIFKNNILLKTADKTKPQKMTSDDDKQTYTQSRFP